MEHSCTYCGSESGLEREHVIPAVWYGFRTFDSEKQWIVTGCRDCNLLAGSFVCFSIPEKSAFILKRYKSRYSKILKSPYWSPKELSEIGWKLRAPIQEAQTQKIILQRRIAHLQQMSELPSNYLRPDWVEKDMAKMEEEFKKIRRSLKRKNDKTHSAKEKYKTTKTNGNQAQTT